MSSRACRPSILVSALAFLAPAPLAAQTALDTSAPQLGDIVVTGEKRETRIQDTPLSITALPGEALRERNINQLVDLDGYVPGLTIAKSEGAERIITIRGIGYETAQNPNSEPGVAFHIDGVYIANVIALNQDLLDVDRIEVLRGPQGTVFGETSTGGAINVITKKPVIGEASGTAELSAGTYSYIKANAAVNIPVGDTIAARASVQYLRHAPYGEATAVPGERTYGLEDANNVGLRGSLIWKLDDRFTALLEGQMFFADHSAALQKEIDDPDPRPRHVTQDYPGTFNLQTRMIYLTLAERLGDVATLKSVTAYQTLDKHQTADNDRLANPFFFDNITRWQDRSRTFTQELSLASRPGTRLDWDVGAFYLRQRALQNIFETTIPAASALVLPDGTGVKFQTDSPYQHSSIAGYGQATWHVGDRLSLIAGARYTWDKVTAQPFQYFAEQTPRRSTSAAVTGKIGAEYRFTPDNMAYVTGSRGYKPTGVSFVSTTPFTPGSFASGPEFVPPTYRKETVWAAEIGTKNDFFDHLLRLNAAGYYYWYKDFQFTAEDPVPFAGGTDNIPHARIWGAEFEGSLLPMRGLRFDGTVSLGRGRFTSHFLTIDAQTAAQVRAATYAAIGFPAAYYYDARVESAVAGARQDVDGNRIPKLPGVQAQGTASYAWHIAGGTVTLRGEIVHRGAFNYRIFAVDAFDRVPAYTIYNAFIRYQPDARPWSVSVSAQNLTNKDGINSRFADPYGDGSTSVEYIDPREIFGTLSFKF